jgi:RNA 2',3'-cyclic 3'-phosphodiesterase
MNPMLWAFQGVVPVRLFFALLPPEEISPAIETLAGTLQHAHRLRGRRITKDRLHNTVAPVWDLRCTLEENIQRATWIGTRINYPPFQVRFEWTGSFRVGGERYPLVMRGEDGLKPLIGFQREVRSQMARAGFVVAQHYTPHITLLWANRCVDEYPIAPIGWTVRDFVLVMSLAGQSRHIPVARWQLHETRTAMRMPSDISGWCPHDLQQ